MVGRVVSATIDRIITIKVTINTKMVRMVPNAQALEFPSQAFLWHLSGISRAFPGLSWVFLIRHPTQGARRFCDATENTALERVAVGNITARWEKGRNFCI